MDVEKLMEETAEHYEGKMAKLFQTIDQLKKRCVRLQNENKAIRRTNMELIRERKERQQYKNKKRGKK